MNYYKIYVDTGECEFDFEHVHFYNFDNSYMVVGSLNVDYLNKFRNSFAIPKKNANFSPAYKNGTWDGYIRFYYKNGLMPRGLLHEAAKKLKDMGIKGKIHPDLFEEKIDISDLEEVTEALIKKQKAPLIPRDYQWRVAEKLLLNKRGIAKAATSSGKTYMIAIVCNYVLVKEIVKKILIITPTVDLVVQGYSDFQEYGIEQDKIGMFMGKTKDADHPMVFATWQTLQNIKEDEFFQIFDMVIVDEVHKCNQGTSKSKEDRSKGGTVIKQILDRCVNANWRIGLTGTLPDELVDQYTAIGSIGRVLVNVEAKELMDRGHISNLKIVCPILSYNKKTTKTQLDEIKNRIKKEYLEKNNGVMSEDVEKRVPYLAERYFLENNLSRVQYISGIVQDNINRGENSLILVHSIAFGKILKEQFEHFLTDYSTIEHIYGDVDIKTREEAKKSMENSTKKVIVATISIFSTGISIKNLHSVILATSTKSKIAVLQSIGRSLRLHKSKDCAIVYDIVDDLKYSQNHAKERQNYYINEKFEVEFKEIEIS